MRTWAATVIFAILLLAAGFWLLKLKQQTDSKLVPLGSALKLIGIINMSNTHTINIKSIRDGDDILLVLDYRGFIDQFIPEHPELKAIYSKPFDLLYYDTKHQGEIDNQEPIWPYLYVVIYGDNGTTYQARSLSEAGIHAILPQHLTPHGDHRVLLSDGDTRVLYEMSDIK